MFDDPIHYVVLNNGENVFNMESIDKLEKVYDEIEKTEGAGVVVTISSSAKFFSTGFDLEWWGNDEINVISGIARMQGLYAKVLSLGLPSLCVVNGHAYGGGFILALCHDNRIMRNDKAKVCLPEINLAGNLVISYSGIVRDMVPNKTFRELVLGIPLKGPAAKEGDIVDHLYSGAEDCEASIKAFAKKYHKVGAMREGIKRNKEFSYKQTLNYLRTTTMAPGEISLHLGRRNNKL